MAELAAAMGGSRSSKSFGSNSRIYSQKQGMETTTEEHNKLEKITQNYTKQTKVEYSAARFGLMLLSIRLDLRKWISAGMKANKFTTCK